MNLPRVFPCSPSWPPLSPPSPSHPSGSSQCTSPEHPVSCIEPGQAIPFTYDNIHVSMPFSQIIPPSPSPTESKRLSYTSVSLLLSRIQVIVTIFLNSKYMHYYTVLVFFFLVYFTLSHKPSSIHIPLLVSLLLFAKHGCKWETGKREGSRKRKKKSSLVTFLTDEDQQFFLFSHYLSWLGFMAEKDSKNPNQWKAKNHWEQSSNRVFAWNTELSLSNSVYIRKRKSHRKKLKWKVKSLSRVRLPATPWTAAYQAPPSMGFSRQEYWSGVPLPSVNANTMRYQKLPIIIEFLTCQKFGEENKLLLMAVVLLFRALARWIIKFSVIVPHQI